MKKLIIVIMIIFSGATLKAAQSDSSKVVNLQNQIEQLTEKNEAIELAFIQAYLEKSGKKIGEAFTDIYLDNATLTKMNQTYIQLINELIAAKSMNEIDAVLLKYGIGRK